MKSLTAIEEMDQEKLKAFIASGCALFAVLMAANALCGALKAENLSPQAELLLRGCVAALRGLER